LTWIFQALDNVMGIRPAWRCAFILQATFGDQISAALRRCGAETVNRIRIGSGLDIRRWANIIGNIGVATYLEMSLMEFPLNSEDRRKLVRVHEEIYLTDPGVREYAQSQSNQQQWLGY
jgi:hypothetical protein